MDMRVVTVLFQDGTRRTYELSEDSRVSSLISQLDLPPDGLRLMFLGHFLSPDQQIRDLSPDHDFTVQCFVVRRTDPPAVAPGEVPRGFDRLSRAGYTAEQIAEIRTLFHMVNRTNHSPSERRLQLEDEWVSPITLAGSPIAAARAIALSFAADRELRITNIQTLDQPPRGRGSGAEAPLLQPDDDDGEVVVQRTGLKSWIPFVIGVTWGLCCWNWLAIASMSFTGIWSRFGIGVLFGVGLRLVAGAL
jgi:hypothetical protein